MNEKRTNSEGKLYCFVLISKIPTFNEQFLFLIKKSDYFETKNCIIRACVFLVIFLLKNINRWREVNKDWRKCFLNFLGSQTCGPQVARQRCLCGPRKIDKNRGFEAPRTKMSRFLQIHRCLDNGKWCFMQLKWQ